MKCPKCGSENKKTEIKIAEYETCLDCGNRWLFEHKPPELSTAEKSLWLVENVSVLSNRYRIQINDYISGTHLNFYWHENGKHTSGDPDIQNILVASRAEAINAAYKHMKEEDNK